MTGVCHFSIKFNTHNIKTQKPTHTSESDALTLDNCDDIHAVAGLLKQYIRELPDPLFTHKYYETFIIVQSKFSFHLLKTIDSYNINK